VVAIALIRGLTASAEPSPDCKQTSVNERLSADACAIAKTGHGRGESLNGQREREEQNTMPVTPHFYEPAMKTQERQSSYLKDYSIHEIPQAL